jgi:hypothetical protein
VPAAGKSVKQRGFHPAENGLIRFLVTLISVLFLTLAAPARAAVTITFYSHDMEMFRGLTTYYPHGFVLLSGTDSAGAAVNANYGFSATSFMPNVLWQPVKGALDEALPDGYLGRSTKHFAFTLSEAQYHAVMDVVEKWRNWPQPSYDIDTHNCVHFVEEIARAAGLAVGDVKKFTREPKEFLQDVAERNAGFLSGMGASPIASSEPPPLPAGNSQALKDRVEELERQRRSVP